MQQVPTLLKLASITLSRNLYTTKEARTYLDPENVPAEALAVFNANFKPWINLRRLILKSCTSIISAALERRRLTRHFHQSLEFVLGAGTNFYDIVLTVDSGRVFCFFAERESSNFCEILWRLDLNNDMLRLLR
jgi:hypothetical protein